MSCNHSLEFRLAYWRILAPKYSPSFVLLVFFFVKVKDGNKVSGKGRVSCLLYEEIDRSLGTRAASSLTVVLDSGEGCAVDKASVETSPTRRTKRKE